MPMLSRRSLNRQCPPLCHQKAFRSRVIVAEGSLLIRTCGQVVIELSIFGVAKLHWPFFVLKHLCMNGLVLQYCASLCAVMWLVPGSRSAKKSDRSKQLHARDDEPSPKRRYPANSMIDCFGCRKPGTLYKVLDNRPFDHGCIVARRSQLHILKKNPKSRTQDKLLMKTDPSAWRKQLNFFMQGEAGRRRTVATRDQYNDYAKESPWFKIVVSPRLHPSPYTWAMPPFPGTNLRPKVFGIQTTVSP